MLHPRNIDRPLASLVAKLPSKASPIMTFSSFIASPPIVAAILGMVVALASFAGNAQLVKTSVIVLALSPVAELSKLITRRRRPETLYVQNMRFKTYSFPSGHSYISALVFGFLAIAVVSWHPFAWALSAFLILLIFTVGISRIYLGAHFPSDVIAGWLLGGSVQFIIYGIG